MRAKGLPVAALVATIVAVGATAGISAATSSRVAPTTFYACKASNGAVSGITTSSALKCVAPKKLVSWNSVGPQGPGYAWGTTGPITIAGPTSTLTLAVFFSGISMSCSLMATVTGTSSVTLLWDSGSTNSLVLAPGAPQTIVTASGLVHTEIWATGSFGTASIDDWLRAVATGCSGGWKYLVH